MSRKLKNSKEKIEEVLASQPTIEIAARLLAVHPRAVQKYGERFSLQVPPRDPRNKAEGFRKLSERRKAWLKQNPEKHPWKRKDKFVSAPCEFLKKQLTAAGFLFQEEFTDSSWTRNFSLDIAFIDRKLAVEVNGRQHYDQTGVLKPYYADRQDYLRAQGWAVLELYAPTVFRPETLQLVRQMVEDTRLVATVPVQKPKATIAVLKHCPCGAKITHKSTACRSCATKRQKAKSTKRPSYEDLLSHLRAGETILCIAKKFNVSDNAVRKWCKYYNLPRPTRGYWQKVQHGHITSRTAYLEALQRP